MYVFIKSILAQALILFFDFAVLFFLFDFTMVLLPVLNFQVAFGRELREERKEMEGEGRPRKISSQELIQALGQRMVEIPEFMYIRQEAERLGLRVYLFGGAASSYLHHVKWNLEGRKWGLSGYDFTDIYRSTQDLDLAVDGPQENIVLLEELLRARFPHFLARKSFSVWELRSLREAKGKPGKPGYKEALLRDASFLNQNTDSCSTGMIEITQPPPSSDQSLIWDLRDPEGSSGRFKGGKFLEDALEGKITLYRSPHHFQTARYLAGGNPEIFSALRALGKAFQYDLDFYEEGWRDLKEIVNSFDPQPWKEMGFRSSYVKRRLVHLGKKLFSQSMDVERTWNILEALGLRRKLIEVDDPYASGSLASWMNREPLRTRSPGDPISKLGTGKTAEELGRDLGLDLSIVTHETRSLSVYENIIRSRGGEPNVFISRKGWASSGEDALYGDGFYTRLGQKGGRGTGISIQFRLDPKARDGEHFLFLEGPNEEKYVLVWDKAVLSIVPESLDLSPMEFFRSLIQTSSLDVSISLGIWDRLKRKISHRWAELSHQEVEEIFGFIEADLEQITPRRKKISPLLEEWFSLRVAGQYPELLERLIEKSGPEIHWYVTRSVLFQFPWKNHQSLIEKIIAGGNGDAFIPIISFFQRSGYSENQVHLVKEMIKKGDQGVLWYLVHTLLFRPEWAQHPDLMNLLIERGGIDVRQEIISRVLPQIAWGKKSNIILSLIHRGGDGLYRDLARAIFSLDHLRNHPDASQWIDKMIQGGNSAVQDYFTALINSPPLRDDGLQLMESLIRRGDSFVRMGIARSIHDNSDLQTHPGLPALVISLIRVGDYQLHKYIESEVFPILGLNSSRSCGEILSRSF